MIEKDKAIQEAECIAAADEYFKARAWIMDTNDNRRIFEAGFDRAYALLPKLRAPVAGEAARIIKLPAVDVALAAFIEKSDGYTALALVQAILDADAKKQGDAL